MLLNINQRVATGIKQQTYGCVHYIPQLRWSNAMSADLRFTWTQTIKAVVRKARIATEREI